jgi:hypothetical protein
LESSTHLALIADAIDRPLAELKELNPAVLRTVAPSGTAVHVPKGMLPLVEAAFRAVPANRRDAWRVHKLDGDDTFATLAKRYNMPSALVSSANHDALPETGSLVVIPVSYPGDRIPARAPVKVATRSNAAAKNSTAGASRNRPRPHAAAPAAKSPTKASSAKRVAGRAG